MGYQVPARRRMVQIFNAADPKSLVLNTASSDSDPSDDSLTDFCDLSDENPDLDRQNDDIGQNVEAEWNILKGSPEPSAEGGQDKGESEEDCFNDPSSSPHSPHLTARKNPANPASVCQQPSGGRRQRISRRKKKQQQQQQEEASDEEMEEEKETEDEDQWGCNKCTFFNSNSKRYCAMCEAICPQYVVLNIHTQINTLKTCTNTNTDTYIYPL